MDNQLQRMEEELSLSGLMKFALHCLHVVPTFNKTAYLSYWYCKINLHYEKLFTSNKFDSRHHTAPRPLVCFSPLNSAHWPAAIDTAMQGGRKGNGTVLLSHGGITTLSMKPALRHGSCY